MFTPERPLLSHALTCSKACYSSHFAETNSVAYKQVNVRARVRACPLTTSLPGLANKQQLGKVGEGSNPKLGADVNLSAVNCHFEVSLDKLRSPRSPGLPAVLSRKAGTPSNSSVSSWRYPCAGGRCRLPRTPQR